MIAWLKDAAFTYEFLADSYLATLAIALVIAYLGVFVVLKRIVFLGITLAQAAASGSRSRSSPRDISDTARWVS